jgi:ligand-binding sensor domain-containing protein
MTEASDGSLWFGVDDGVVRYDGIEWVDYAEEDGIYGSSVVTLCATRDGRVYAGTDLGVSRFRQGQWERLSEGDVTWGVNRLSVGTDGDVWAATVWGAMRMSEAGHVLYSSAGIAEALEALAPEVRVVAVPDAVTVKRHQGVHQFGASAGRRTGRKEPRESAKGYTRVRPPSHDDRRPARPVEN